MWVQFARQFDSDHDYRRCLAPGCGKWLQVSREPGGHIKRRVFCGESCRVKAHRERQARARELRAKGRSLHTIATEVGSDVEIVKRWEAKGDRREHLPLPNGRRTVGEFLAQWLEESVKPSARPRTFESYEFLVKKHLEPTLGADSSRQTLAT